MATTALTAGLLAPDLVALGEDQSAATAKDVILARKNLMNAIEENTDRIARMISDREINVSEARARAYNVYVLLTALPHLFPPNSNQWKEGADLDPVTDIPRDMGQFCRLLWASVSGGETR